MPYLSASISGTLPLPHRRLAALGLSAPSSLVTNTSSPSASDNSACFVFFRQAKLHSAPFERGELGCGSRAAGDGRGLRGLKAGWESILKFRRLLRDRMDLIKLGEPPMETARRCCSRLWISSCFARRLSSSFASASLFYVSGVSLVQEVKKKTHPCNYFLDLFLMTLHLQDTPNLHQPDQLSIPQTNNLVERYEQLKRAFQISLSLAERRRELRGGVYRYPGGY